MRRALGRPGFRRLFAAQMISRWGDTFNSVALVVLVYRLTGSGVKVAGTVVFEIAPVILFGFMAGAVADRHPRRRVMVAADLGRAAVALLLVAVPGRLGVVYFAAFALSALSVFFNPAASSVVPSLVDADDVVGANSALWSAAVISQIALAPLAGAVVAAFGARPAFGLNAASFVASALLLGRLPLPARPVALGSRHLSDVAEGLRTIRSSRFLTVLAAVQGLAALSAGATSALLVVLAERHLGVGPGRFGLLIAAIGVGAGLGPLVLQRIVGDVRRPAFVFGPYLLRGGTDVVLAASASFPVALGALALYGVGTSTGNVAYSSVLQTAVPDRLRGRVFAFYDVVWQTARLLSIAVGGVLADRLGIAAVYGIAGLVLIGAGALGFAAGGRRYAAAAPG
ncbi:MAG: MFS transporter [Actinobacteria bacterium]|nr:MFS transporter [Actinomycetota bacterium]